MTSVGEGGLVLLPGEARRIEMGGIDVRVHADHAATGGAFSLVETAESIRGSGPPVHLHRDAAESFYVVAGEYEMYLEGREFRCPAGSFIYIPTGMPHTFRSLTESSRKLNIYTPAAMVGYFGDLADAIRQGVDDAGLADIAERYAMTVLGPAPQGYL